VVERIINLHLNSEVFSAGGMLSGIVELDCKKPIDVRAIWVQINGTEKPRGSEPIHLFSRQVILTGRTSPKIRSDRISLLWNSFLGRETGRTIPKGEHIYPFAILLPESIPASYEGNVGSIEYKVTAGITYPVLKGPKVTKDVEIASIPRIPRGRMVAVSYPSASSMVHGSLVKVELSLEHRAVSEGDCVSGKFRIINPENTNIPSLNISLEACEWLKTSRSGNMPWQEMSGCEYLPEHSAASEFEVEFSLPIPENVIPTIDSSKIAVIWLLKLVLYTASPMEFRTPIVVYNGGAGV
jgi:hypothetical protein